MTHLYGKLSKVQGKSGPTLILKFITRDHEAARKSSERMLAWDSYRIIVAHGAVYEGDGKAALREKFAWLLKD